MVIGDNGLNGVLAHQHVMEEHRKEQGSAMILHLRMEAPHVMEMKFRLCHAIYKHVQLMEIGELGALGINAQFHVEVELKKVQGSVTILQLYMEEILVLEMIQEVRFVTQIVVQVRCRVRN